MGATLSTSSAAAPSAIKAAIKAGNSDALAAALARSDCEKQLLADCSCFHAWLPIHYACKYNKADILKYILHQGKELECRLCLIAASQGRPKKKGGFCRELVNAKTDRGVTPLMLAAGNGCLASCQLLLSLGADPWAVDRLGGRSALHYAMKTDSPQVTQLLIDAAGATGPVQYPNLRHRTRFVDLRTQNGLGPIHYAVHAKATRALAVLINSNANITVRSSHDIADVIMCGPAGSSPLHLAAAVGSEEVALQLLQAQVDGSGTVNGNGDLRLWTNSSGHRPCDVASARGLQHLAELLHPDTPLPAVLAAASGNICLLGPASLAALAAAALREKLLSQLSGIVGKPLLPGAAGEPAGCTGGRDPSFSACKDGKAHGTSQLGRPVAGRHSEASCGCAQALVAAACKVTVLCPTCDSLEEAQSTLGDGDDSVCCICLEAAQAVTLKPCNHQVCAVCCMALLTQNHKQVMMCPLCRAQVAGLDAAAASTGKAE